MRERYVWRLNLSGAKKAIFLSRNTFAHCRMETVSSGVGCSLCTGITTIGAISLDIDTRPRLSEQPSLSAATENSTPRSNRTPPRVNSDSPSPDRGAAPSLDPADIGGAEAGDGLDVASDTRNEQDCQSMSGASAHPSEMVTAPAPPQASLRYMANH